MLCRRSLCVLFAGAFVTQAAVFRLPLSDCESTARGRDGPPVTFDVADHPQRILQGETAHGPMRDAGLFGYGLNITLGTPPQQFEMLLDIQWTTLFVEDSRCQTIECKYWNHTGFNVSESSTFISSDKRLELDYEAMTFAGNLAHDILDVNGLKIPGQRFLDATDINARAWVSFYSYPALGFATQCREGIWSCRPDVPSPWQSIVSLGLLEHNVFSIAPIPGVRNSKARRIGGELTLGGYPSTVSESDAVNLPIKSDKRGSWATSLEHMSFGGFSMTFASNASTYFITDDPFIYVPRKFGKQVIMWLGNYEPGPMFQIIACDKREKLFDWTFGIGGRNITLTPYQYIFEFERFEDENSEPVTYCALGMAPAPYEDMVGLGWPFWENFKGVAFDLEKDTISLFL